MSSGRVNAPSKLDGPNLTVDKMLKENYKKAMAKLEEDKAKEKTKGKKKSGK